MRNKETDRNSEETIQKTVIDGTGRPLVMPRNSETDRNSGGTIKKNCV